MTGLFTSIRFIMALITVLAIVAKPLIPARTLHLHPQEDTYLALFGSGEANGRPVANWVDQAAHHWRCETNPHQRHIQCGLVMSWHTTGEQECRPLELHDSDIPPCLSDSSDPDGDGWGWENERSCLISPKPIRVNHVDQCPQGTDLYIPRNQLRRMDASQYDHFRLKIHYEGRAQYVRMVVRNHDPQNIVNGRVISEKFMSTLLRTEGLRAGYVYVKLKDFHVDEWWTLEQNPPRHMAQPEFNKVTLIGIDHVEPGVHHMRVEELTLEGERISDETYFLILLLFWIALIGLEIFIRHYNLRMSNNKNALQLRSLTGDTQQLEREKNQLKNRALTDALTCIPNRQGLNEHIKKHYPKNRLPSGCSLLILDLDHFKQLNDTHGHQVGDEILREFSLLINGLIRQGDFFARWGGEEFVLLCQSGYIHSMNTLAEKLRQHVEESRFILGKQANVTVSIGIAIAKSGETFEDLFNRADRALYQAKKTRNTVAYNG